MSICQLADPATRERSAVVRRQYAEWLAQAEAALALGDTGKAIVRLNDMLQGDRDHIGALELLARALWTVGQTDEVLAILSRLIALNPYEPGYFQLRANVLAGQGKFDGAATAFRRAECIDQAEELEEVTRLVVRDRAHDDPVFRARVAQQSRRRATSSMLTNSEDRIHFVSRA